ncbi:MAG TPA: mechanosensitive ion channel domain-containing protein [Thermoanaerobaculia bacterium]|nr:mechanosensitive ion channel domain-containing protein [Thermoanaerobaculia bacterium]
MNLALATLAGLSVLAVLVWLLLQLQRSSFLARQLGFPLYVAAATAGLWTATLFPAGQRAQTVLEWALVFLVCVTVLRVLGLLLFDVHLHGRRGLRLPPLLPAVAMGLAYVVTALVSLRLAFPKFPFTALLASGAVTSLVLGLALQPILGNFFAGLVISLERPFRINDWIKVGETQGRVVAINWRTTHLRTRDNDNLVIPNSKISDERVLNYFYPQPMHLERIQVGVHYRTPPYRVRRALLECVAGVPGALEKPTPEVFLLAFGDNAVTYELRVWIEDIAQQPRIASDLRMRIWEEFKREGLVIPYPIRTLEVTPRARPRLAAEEAGPPPARLFVAEGPDRGLSLELDGAPVTLGRSRGCSLALADPNASKEHLQIEWTPEGYLMSDLGSSFGTRLNGQPATSAVLRPLDRIAIGETTIVFESDAG